MREQSQKKKKSSNEFENFDHTMRNLMSVSHDEIKAELEAEKVARKSKRREKSNVEVQTDALSPKGTTNGE